EGEDQSQDESEEGEDAPLGSPHGAKRNAGLGLPRISLRSIRATWPLRRDGARPSHPSLAARAGNLSCGACFARNPTGFARVGVRRRTRDSDPQGRDHTMSSRSSRAIEATALAALLAAGSVGVALAQARGGAAGTLRGNPAGTLRGNPAGTLH